MKQPRLADVAALAQVSEATVSRVINDKPGVAGSTRQAVHEALDLLGYHRAARIRRTTAGLVGLIVPELGNPIFPAFAQAIATSLIHNGYTPVLCTQTPGGVHEDEYVQMLLDRGVAGIIFVSGHHADTTTDPSRYTAQRAAGLPIVLVNGHIPGVPAPFVSADDATGMDLAVAHLSALGHTQIGLALGPMRYVPVIRKAEGFRAAMAARLGRTDVDDLIAWSFFSVTGGGATAATLLDRGCTAIICASDLMALGAVREIRRRGLSVPRDVSVVGYDDSPLIEFTHPPLTTLRQNVGAMGEAAVHALLDEIGGAATPGTDYVFRPELVVRESTGAAPAGRRVPAAHTA